MQGMFTHLTAHQSLVRAGSELLGTAAAGWSFLRVCAGRGYLMSEPNPQEIGPGDLVVTSTAANVSLRASQLGDMRLCHFGVCPEQLSGFFTTWELNILNSLATNGPRLTRVIPVADEVAQEHAELCGLRQREPGVLARSAMLSVAVRALRDILAPPPGTAAQTLSAEEKFAVLAARVPESELLRRSGAELAAQCGCSERHLRRLYTARFGKPLLQRQLESRIQRAKRLLLETDAKIIDIAGRCGFQSLSQFNSTFKRITRQTPGDWRQTAAIRKAKHSRLHPPLCPNSTHERQPA